MREYDDPWWESCDEDGNPEFSAYGPKEEPDCPPCGDTGHRTTRLGRRRPCRDCNPTRLDVLRATARWRIRAAWSRLRGLTRRRRPDPSIPAITILAEDEPPF